MAQQASPLDAVIDVGDADFEERVLQRSREIPVIVDFWAPWCGPCRSLGPLLERVVAEHPGEVQLAKVNVDESPVLAQRFQVRSIPLVMAFRDGAPLTEFLGAQPEAVVRQFVDAVVPSEADRLAVEGAELLAAGHANAAEERLRAALEKDPRHPQALLDLARLLAGRGADAEALDLLERVTLAPPALEQEAERLAAEIRTRASAPAGGGELEALRQAVEESPEDLAARLALGQALAAARRDAEALAALLAVVERDRSFADEAARKAMLDLFEVLGSDHPLTQEFRSALARALFR